jgi:hypothetical protein
MKIELVADVNPGQGSGPEFTQYVESDKFDQTDVDKIVDSLKTWISAQTSTVEVPVNFKVLVDGAEAANEDVQLRHNDVSVVATFAGNTMRARKLLRDG